LRLISFNLEMTLWLYLRLFMHRELKIIEFRDDFDNYYFGFRVGLLLFLLFQELEETGFEVVNGKLF